jgi:hypothetical protein
MKKIILVAALFSVNAMANLHLSPPDFDTKYGRAVFVDFKTAEYNITYDIVNEVTTVKSLITFEAKSAGMPLFDLVPYPDSVKLDGKKAKQRLISFPGGLSKLRQLSTSVAPGIHTLEIENIIDTNVTYQTDFESVSSAFWIRDLKDRLFLEQYVPSNFEFDQYQMTINVKFEGVRSADQDFYTNGKISKTSPVSWKIEFPEYFTSSCPFYHVTPKGWMSRRDFSYTSISGREIPITVYSPWSLGTSEFSCLRDYGRHRRHGALGSYGHFIWGP